MVEVVEVGGEGTGLTRCRGCGRLKGAVSRLDRGWERVKGLVWVVGFIGCWAWLFRFGLKGIRLELVRA